jgi:hypothetical protein
VQTVSRAARPSSAPLNNTSLQIYAWPLSWLGARARARLQNNPSGYENPHTGVKLSRRTMEIHEPGASRRHDEDASAPEAYRVYTTTTSCRDTLKALRDREIVHPFVTERLQDGRICDGLWSKDSRKSRRLTHVLTAWFSLYGEKLTT